jgi:hypothetical protein
MQFEWVWIIKHDFLIATPELQMIIPVISAPADVILFSQQKAKSKNQEPI